jgi:putative oxygen-independent coproporphyrinogen III oxidase
MDPAGLYIHVPFCSRVCPYCDFAVTIAGGDRRQGYVDALEREIERSQELEFEFDTVYFGGGTPSSLSVDRLRRIVAAVRSHLVLSSDTTWSLEVNPEDVTPAAATSWRELGFDVVSLGVQSFNDDELTFLGRRHTALQARLTAECLIECGFSTVSLDLIFGLPGETADLWRRRLETALELGVGHLSCYQLTIHDGTRFANRRQRGELAELDEDDQADLYLLTHEVLGEAGWHAYEVSNFAAAPVHRSRHNRKYWNHVPYLGLGPSAHSFDGRRRWWNLRKVRLWTAAAAHGQSTIAGEEQLGDRELASEAVMLGLRTADGLDLDAHRRRFGDALGLLDDSALDRMVACGFLEHNGGRLTPTARGMAVADGLARFLMP